MERAGMIVSSGLRKGRGIDPWGARPILEKTPPSKWGEAEVGDRLETDLLVTGAIRTFRLRDPKTSGLLHGTVEIDLRIHDYQSRQATPLRIEAHFPPDRSLHDAMNFGADAMFMTEEKIEQGLIDQAALRIASLFCEIKGPE
jgi:hypothetical protein